MFKTPAPRNSEAPEGRRMKFQLAIDLERMVDDIDMREVARHMLATVQIADAGGVQVSAPA